MQFIAVQRSEPPQELLTLCGHAMVEADAISSQAFVPIMAADRFSVGYLRSIAVRLSNMQHQKS